MLHFRQILTVCFSFFLFSLAAQCPITVDAGEDVYLCAPPTPTQLNGDISGGFLNFHWSPTTGMTGSGSLTPTVTVSQTTSYALTATAPDFSNNVVDNGDFEQGNSGFTSDYIYNPGDLVPEGYYDVLDNPQDDHPGFAPCNDHTSGSGNMMVVNGAGSPNQNVWCQTVNVMPNTQYVLSAWVTSVVASSPAKLQFNINGSPLGPIFNAPGSTCVWQNYFQIWNSGGNSSATICIVNQNTTLGGNDFALDDIVFAPVCTVSDTVTVNVIKLTAVASPPVVTLPCDGASVTLSGTGSSAGPNITYEWTTPNGNIVSGANTLTPTVNAPGEYVLTVSYEVNGNAVCTKTATVNVILNPNPLSAWITPPQPLGCGAPTTLLIGNSNQGGFSTYEWSTTNGNIVNGADQKNCTVNLVGTYTLLVTNTNTGCTATAETTVTLTNNVPVANANSNGIITCAHDSVPLLGAGSSSGSNIVYSWTTVNGHIIGHPDSLNSIASAGGLYILHVTNTSNNCTSNDTVSVPANVTLPTVIGTLPPQISCDPNQDTISLFIYVGPPPFVLINWTTSDGHIVSGQYTPAPQANLPGTYSVSVFDPANGCYNFDTSQVFANFTIPMADILPADTVTCQSPSIQLQGSGSTVGANFSINWTASNGGNIVSGGNTLTPTVNAAGDYLLILRDSVSLCADTAMVSVQADTNVVVAIANAPDTLTCAVHSVDLNANGSSSGGNLTYLWTTTDGNISGSNNIPNPTATTPGTYQLLLTNIANGCSATDLAVVEQNTAPPPISIQTPDTLTCAVLSQVLQGVNSSGSGIFSYHWTASSGGNISSGDSTLTPTINQPGLYTLTATNLVNGCTSSASATVAVEMGFPSVVAATPGQITCATPAQVLNSGGSSTGPNFQYQWTTPDGTISAGPNTPSPTVTDPGTYILQITNTANGCKATDTVSVSANKTAPPADAGAPATLTCSQPLWNLDGNAPNPSANLNFNWSSSNGHFTGPTNVANVTVDAAGDYTLVVTDPVNGCTSSDVVQILANQQIPGLNIAPPAILTCLVTSVSFNAAATGQNLQYNWQTANGNFVSGQNAAAVTVDQAGDYSITVTDGVNGCSAVSSVTVAQDTAHPNIAIAPPPTITCDSPSVTLQGIVQAPSPNLAFNWTTSGGATILTGANGLTPVIGSGGVVIFACFNVQNGCSTTVSDTVPQNTVFPTADAGLNDTLSCLTNSLTINGSGAGGQNLEYSWQTSAGGNILNGGNTATPTVNQPGVYTLTVENPANGCTASDQVQVFNDSNAPNANAGTAATLTCMLQQTTLNGTASTGPTFSYQWTTSGGGNIFSGANSLTPVVDNPGVYTLAVSNSANGCVATSSVTVPENVTPPVVDAGASATITCATTSLTLNGSTSGGTATYAWSTQNGQIVSGGNTLQPVVNQNGTYTLTATLGSNGCTASDVVTVNIDTLAPAFQIEPTLLLTCSQLTTALVAMVQQPGPGNFTASWTTTGGHFAMPQNALNTSADAPGAYFLLIKNNLNGCQKQLQIVVNQDTTAPLATIAAASKITCASPTIQIDASGSSSGSPYWYKWTTSGGGNIQSGNTTPTPTVNAPGNYMLEVHNADNGCFSFANVTVGIDTVSPQVAIAAPGALTCVQQSVPLNASGSSQGTSFSAAWATSNGHIVSGNNTLNPVVDKIGLYTLTISNSQNGCTESAQVSVSQNITPPGALILPAPLLHCNLPQINLQASSPTVGNLSYSWATTNGSIVTGNNSATPLVNAPGLYTLTITNPGNGCTSTSSASVSATPDPDFQPVLTQPNCLIPTGALDFGNVSGGKSPFRFSVNDGQTFTDAPTFSHLTPGVYALLVQDANGCTSTETATIDPPFEPSLDLAGVEKIEQGDSVLLSPVTNIPPSQIASWEWSPAEHLSCTDCQEPWAKPLHSQYYTVEVKDLNGCKAEDRILVQVSRQRHIYPPTVFSPNDDGENDRFTLYAKGVKEIRRLAIFDRWGEELFVREHFPPNDDSLGWDGNFRGTPLTPAVFVWAAEVEYTDGEVEVIYGDVTIVR